jgi:hypothetical protein
MNFSNKSLSMNVFHLRGMTFIPENKKPDINRESDIKTYSRGETVWMKLAMLPWRRGAVVIASASGTRRPEFKSRQGIRLLGKHSSAVVCKMTYYVHCLCAGHKNVKKILSYVNDS